MRACLYRRCSTLDQDPALAREELRAAARARGMDVTMEIEESGSGARNDRPGLQRVLEAARRGNVQAVLSWKLDRFGRSALDLLSNIKVLEDAGVRFIAITQGIDIRPDGDAMSKLLVTMLAAVATFELDLIRERTRLGVAKARRLGKHVGRPRKGAVPRCEEVTRLRSEGASWASIASALGCTSSAARRAATTR